MYTTPWVPFAWKGKQRAPFEKSTRNRTTMPLCRECGKEVQEDWIACPYCSRSIGPPAPKTINQLNDSVQYSFQSDLTLKQKKRGKNLLVESEEIKALMKLLGRGE